MSLGTFHSRYLFPSYLIRPVLWHFTLENIPIWIRSIFSSIVCDFYVQKYEDCMLLSLTLTQAARSAGRSCLFTHYNCHCHIASPPMTSTLFLSLTHSLTHDACCLSWFPFCSSFCHVHCCCYGRERERERERYLYVEQVRERKKENWLHVPYLEVDYSIATYKIEIGIKVFFGFCPLLEHHPIHLLSVRWAEAELGVLEGVGERAGRGTSGHVQRRTEYSQKRFF